MKTLIALSSALLLTATAAFANPAAAQSHGHDRGDQRSYQHDRGRDDHRDYNNDRRDDRRDYREDRRDERGEYGDRREESRRYYATRQYRAPQVYVVPRGYRASRWNVGSRLPQGYYGNPYYVDYANYGLRAPPRGYRWVRVDRDVYMVQAMSGVIADVLYGIFR